MKKALLIFVVVAGIIVAVAAFKNKTAVAPGPTETPMVSENISPSPTVSATGDVSPTVTPTASPSPSPSAAPLSQTVTITFANGTVTPANVTIHAGDMVKFVNNDSAPRWPASGVHPTHQICSGFDALRGLAIGESYSFQFNETKTCPWHDHLNPSIKGQIIISL